MAWLAFLPWLRLKEPVKAGRYELLPYDAQSQTTNPEPVEAIKSLLAPYWQRGDLPGRFSTVVRRDGQLVHDNDIRDEEVNELFRFSEYLGVDPIWWTVLLRCLLRCFLHGVYQLEFDRAVVIERRVAAARVVEAVDVFAH